MLLTTKIEELVTLKPILYEDRLDVFNKVLKSTGLVKTRNFMMIDILYYLLEQEFTQEYINRELYKRLNHLLNITETIDISNNPTTVVSSVPALTVSISSKAFGSIEVGEESATTEVTLTGSDLTEPITVVSITAFKVSLYPVSNFSNGCVLFPKEGVVNTTLFIKFVPISATSYSSNIEIYSTEITTKLIACTGTGIVTP